MLSYSDLKRISFLDSYDANEIKIDNAIYNMLSIEQIMVKKPIMVTSTISIKSVVEILSENEFHALPVVDNEILVGIVTIGGLGGVGMFGFSALVLEHELIMTNNIPIQNDELLLFI